MTVFVTAAAKHGSTGEIAEAIGAALTERRKTALVLPAEGFRDICEYAAVVVGSAVYDALQQNHIPAH